MLRGLIAVVVGSVTALLLMGAMESLGLWLYPPPLAIDRGDADQMREYFATAPDVVLLLLLAGWGSGALVGGWLAASIAEQRPFVTAAAVAAVMGLCVLSSLKAMPPAPWFLGSAVLLLVVAPWMAGRHALRLSQPPSPASPDSSAPSSGTE